MGDLTRNFDRAEFACGDGCGFDQISRVLVAALQRLRDRVKKPITVLSGCRCKKHNAAVGGALGSMHLVGRAADIRVEGMTPAELYQMAVGIPAFRGFGRDDERGFLHLDVRTAAVRAKWCYREGRQVKWYEPPNVDVQS